MQAIPAVAPRGLQRLFAAVALTLALFAAGVGVASSWPDGSHAAQRTIPLVEIPHGVSETVVSGYVVILVRTGDDVVALSPVDGRADQVVWCPADERFASERAGSVFAADGTKLGGPAPGPLTRYDVSEEDGAIVVRMSGAIDQPVVRAGHRSATRPGHGSACPRG